MNLLSDIRLRWYDDSSLLKENPRELVELFMKSIGISSEVAIDLFEVMLMAKSRDIGLTRRDIKSNIIELRNSRKTKNAEDGLTDRNIQIWLKYFMDIKLVDRIGKRYRFTNNKKPSVAFSQYTKPLVDESVLYVEKILKKLEEEYKIKK